VPGAGHVLIYLDQATREDAVDRVLARLRPGGRFFTGSAEGRTACATALQVLAPGVFRKAGN